MKNKDKKISILSFRKAMEYTTKNNPNAVITVGIIKDGQSFYTIYGENGKELPNELHTKSVQLGYS